MPVVTVTAPRLAESDLAAALGEIAVAVAAALELRPSDVHLVAVASAASAVGDRQVPALPVVLLHGGRRARSAMEAARDAAADVAARRWNCPPERVWVQWVLTDEER